MKDESLEPPNIYLGRHVQKVDILNGATAVAFSSSQYVQEAVRNMEKYLKYICLKLSNRTVTPTRSEYRPDKYVPEECLPVDAEYEQSLIGILIWMVELVRIDICLETSNMSSNIKFPREEHHEHVFYMSSYLNE